MRTWHVAAAAGVIACALVLAQEPGAEEGERDQLIQQIGRLEQQLQAADEGDAEALEQQIDRLRARLGEIAREEEFREIRGRHRDRVWQIEMEISELREHLAGREDEMPQAHRDLAEGRLAHMETLRDLSKQVATLRGPAELEEAFGLLGQIEAAEMRWRLVETPKLEGAVRLYEMAQAAARFDNPPELLVAVDEARELRSALIADAEDLFERWTKHRQMRREFDEALDGFWQKVERAQAGAERLP